MERENRELYKNCAQLQQQISQLEMENGNRIIELTKKQQEEQSRQAQKIKAEKIQVRNKHLKATITYFFQIERIIEQRERMCKQRIAQLESQIATLREQLDGERRRRRDNSDRQIIGDINRLGGNYFGLPRTGGFSSVGSYPLPDNNIDSSSQR